MSDDDDTWYGSITRQLAGVSDSLLRSEGGSADGDSSNTARLTRRSYLAGTGATAAALAGCSGRTERAVVRPVTVFGYGGGTVIRQSEKISTSVTESEPNDTQQAAMRVELDTRVSGDLAPSDSDWYAFDVSSGQVVAVSLQRSAQTGVTAVVLYDADGVFDNLRYVSTDEEVTFAATAETSGTHYVQVVDTQSSDGAYTLTLATATDTSTTTETDRTETPVSTESSTETSTPTSTATPTSTVTPTPIDDDYGEQGYGEYGYGGIKA